MGSTIQRFFPKKTLIFQGSRGVQHIPGGWGCYAFVRVCLFVPCGHLLGKGWPLGSSFWCLIVSVSLSQWYPGSGAVLDCIDS